MLLPLLTQEQFPFPCGSMLNSLSGLHSIPTTWQQESCGRKKVVVYKHVGVELVTPTHQEVKKLAYFPESSPYFETI
jgi:hypothetical protein